MPTDPIEEWRRLSALYSEMGDIEIQELADQINDLTPTAQNVLRDELKKRSLPEGRSTTRHPVASRQDDAQAPWHEEDDTIADIDSDSDNPTHAYTWKVGLCRCESTAEAAARSEMLRRAGIESWIQHPNARFVVPWLEFGVGNIQINVGADQLEQARTIIDQPIPQDILDQLHEESATSEYEIPTCPKCGAPDPVLESVEPSNNWLCESCDHTWSDPVTEDAS